MFRPQSEGHAVLPPAAAAATLALQRFLHGACALALGRLCRDRRDQPGGRYRPAASSRAVLQTMLQAARCRVLQPGGTELMAFLDPTARAIVNGLQAGFPLTSRPFRDAASDLGLSEDELIERISELVDTRSEERRVGKECRYRWWRQHI